MAKKPSGKKPITMKQFEGSKADMAVDRKALKAINKKRKK
jgi:hypothetical protein